MTSDRELSTLTDILRRAARDEVLPRYRALAKRETTTKSSASDLVTVADTAMEAAVSAEVGQAFPEIEVIGEEGVFADPGKLDRIKEAERALILDPIDGTWNFAHGLPIFGVIAAVIEHGETVAGVIYDPLWDDCILARRGGGAWYQAPDGNLTRLSVAGPKPISEMIGSIEVHLFPKPLQSGLAGAGVSFARIGSQRCSAYEYRLAAQGAIDFVMNWHLNPWDHAAGVLIHREAGGTCALIDGTPYSPTLRNGQLLIAPDDETWELLQSHFTAAVPELLSGSPRTG